MEFETIHFERGNGIARLALNRPEKLNAFNVLMHLEVSAALDAVEADESLRVLLMRAAAAFFARLASLEIPSLYVEALPSQLAGAPTRGLNVAAFKKRRPTRFTGR